MTATELVILVDKNDNPIGTAEKLAAHQQGLLHRAFSIFIINNGKILLQQRAAGKYHSPMLWTNTCCSHPRPNEDILQAGKRRLQEELNITTNLTICGKFHYTAHFANGLIENELDYVLLGNIEDESINFNSKEVNAVRWVTFNELREEMATQPERFTPWLEQALAIVQKL